MFEAKEWAALIGRSILPKLAYTMDAEFAVNPVAQELQPWHWVRPPYGLCTAYRVGSVSLFWLGGYLSNKALGRQLAGMQDYHSANEPT